ncbi:MAG TPA: ThuA domain-containing protein [Chloroflexota bacterium]|nr:ThuA domain-containing protein [Chloroflexota bacterium]
MSDPIRVTVWNEFRHERDDDEVKAVYPDGIHNVIAGFLGEQDGVTTRTATLDEPEHGLTQEALDNTDVLTWWGHLHHDKVDDEIVERIQHRVINGMGLICLHSAHLSKIFRRLMGTDCMLRWREAAERERVWVLEPGHPIARGLGSYFEVPQSEMYGERFDIPAPDELIFTSWFQGGDVFRSGCCYRRSLGRIFYFSPGHETFPIYFQDEVQTVIKNAVQWAAPTGAKWPIEGNTLPLEDLPEYEPPDFAQEV